MQDAAGGTPRPQRRGSSIAMTPAEVDVFLSEQRMARVATVDASGRPHVTPLWFVWSARSLWLYSLTRSSRWVHIAEHPQIAVVIDAGEAYDELRGVELRGRATAVGEVPRGSSPHPILDGIEAAHAEKYRPGRPFEPDGRHAWIALEPRDLISWDFRKLAQRGA